MSITCVHQIRSKFQDHPHLRNTRGRSTRAMHASTRHSHSLMSLCSLSEDDRTLNPEPSNHQTVKHGHRYPREHSTAYID